MSAIQTDTGNKRALDGCKNCCNSFTIFVEKFSELIFGKLGFFYFWIEMSIQGDGKNSNNNSGLRDSLFLICFEGILEMIRKPGD